MKGFLFQFDSDEKYGQAADECGEAYFYYGKSLLEVAR